MPSHFTKQATLDLANQARRLLSRKIAQLEDKQDFPNELQRRIHKAELISLEALIEEKLTTKKVRRYIAILLEFLAADCAQEPLFEEIFILRNKIYPEIPMRTWDVGNIMN